MAIVPSSVSRAPRKLAPTGRPASFGLLALFLVAAPVGFAACSDDGNVLGSEGNAGMSNGGASAGNATAGSAHAGTMTSAGTAGSSHAGGTSSAGGAHTGGGSSGTGGSSGAGGATCETAECVRANVCLDKCGGNVVYTGCCACTGATVEELSCGDGGQGSGGAASSDCVGMTCAAHQTCVAYRTVGGAVSPPDTAGNCPAGRHLEHNLCQSDFAYTCAELAGCTAPDATCRCAADTKCANDPVCSLPTNLAWLDTSADLVCELQAP